MKKMTALLRHVKSYLTLAVINCFPGVIPTRRTITWYIQIPKALFLFSILFVTAVSGFSQQNAQKDKDLVLLKVRN
jgi:uncharacterized membrane protein YjdF